MLLDHVRGDDLGSLRIPRRDAAGSGDLARRREPRARRAHHRLGPLPPVRGARAAALEDLRRPRADPRERPHRLSRRCPRAALSGTRAHRVHEGRRAREIQAADGLEKAHRLTGAAGKVEADAASVLAEARFFSGLTNAQRAQVAALARVRTFPQDTRIYTIGDAVDDFYEIGRASC